MRIARTGPMLLACVLALAAGCSREPQDWAAAQRADTGASYQQFLQQHPNSDKAPQAQARIKQLAEERDWQAAAAADSRDAYEQFLAQHADSKYAQEARIRVENFAQIAAGTPGAVGTTGASAAPGAATTVSAPGAAPVVASPEAAPAAAAPGTGRARTPVARTVPAPAAARDQHHAQRSGTPSAKTRAGGAQGGASYVQLGAFSSKARAQTQWQQLQRRFAALHGLTPHYVEAGKAPRRLYRLRVGTSSAAAAQKLCSRLRRGSQACLVVPR